ncbi:MAG: GH3 auxin-responsive promoter family protein [Cytophagaceae bacterium]|jgi:hypothetical protein|nr:GH3 auxin-responsive promoter family protein [Cytophagaceae bacterium]
MPILGSLLSKEKLTHLIEQDRKSPYEYQRKELKKLIKAARSTQFGKKYNFNEILKSFSSHEMEKFYEFYKSRVPVFSYNELYKEWWHKTKAGEEDVCWPGMVKYFALSSGTSEASTKHIPITKEMISSNKKTSLRQVLSLVNYKLPKSLFGKGILMLGGSIDLNKVDHYYEGDLSGIQASKIPRWFLPFYKPGKKIARTRDWNLKLDEITQKSRDWDIGFVVGVPAWIQLMLERVIEYNKVSNIHEVWPNLHVFVHGGVSFEPYKASFQKLLGRPISYIETYLASEGFIALQTMPEQPGMRMVLNNGIFFEFIPFTDENFNADGELVVNPQTYMIHQVEEGKEYALLLSTNAGTWRYLIGDVIRFVNKERCEIIITGRTKHYLSLCGEHLSVENMNKAISAVSSEFSIEIREFAVAGIHYQSMFAHKWFLACDNPVDAEKIKDRLDHYLKECNDDYKTERIAALKEIFVYVLPLEAFYGFMETKGKVGGQHKFPRVLKKNMLEDWEKFLLKKYQRNTTVQEC